MSVVVSHHSAVPAPLRNTANNCWANSLIQVLFHADALQVWLRENVGADHPLRLMQLEYTSASSDVGQRLRTLLFPASGATQQDAAEALYLLWTHAPYHTLPNPPLRVVTETEYTVHKITTSLESSIPVDQMSVLGADGRMSRSERSWGLSVLQDLDELAAAGSETQINQQLVGWRREVSDVRNLFRCTNAERTSVLYCSPVQSRVQWQGPFLFLTLQRMRMFPRPSKFQGNIAIPEILQTTDDASTSYQLFGMVRHFGDIGGGHYISYVRARDSTGHWWVCDDSRVSSLGTNSLPLEIRQQGYVYYFEKKKQVRTVSATTLTTISTPHKALFHLPVAPSNKSTTNVTNVTNVRHVMKSLRVETTQMDKVSPDTKQPPQLDFDPARVLSSALDAVFHETLKGADDVLRWVANFHLM